MFAILLAASIKSVIVLALAWVVTLLMRSRSAAARHLVWTGAAIALLALPFVSISLPGLSIPGASLLEPATFTASATAIAEAWQPAAAAASPISFRDGFNWRTAILAVWATVAILGFLRMAIGYVAIWRIRRRAGRWQGSDTLAQSLGIDGGVDVFLTDPGSMPMTAGPLRPAVFLPEDAREWREDRRDLVLLHELAHVRRGDPALHLIARIAVTLYWWNPLAWIGWREFLKERERAADDLVLNAGARASDYAGHLLAIARDMRVTAFAGSAAIAMARKSQLEGRLMSILDSKIDRRNPRIGVWIAAVLAIALVAPIAALRAQEQVRTSKQIAANPNAPDNLIKLGQSQLAAKNFDQAIEFFQRARLADPQKSGLALMWEAVANDRAGNGDQAESLFKSALAQQDSRSMDYARTEKIYAQFLRGHQRAEESVPLDANAEAIMKANSTAAATQDGVYRIGGDVKQPQILIKTEPSYSEEARIAKLQGQVQLSLVIGVDGLARDVQVTRSLGFGLDEKAVEAVSLWRFSPGMKDGEAVPVYATIEVNFRLL